MLPPTQNACVLKTYAETLGLEQYESIYHMGKTNAGISAYFEHQLSENPCFAAVATKYVEQLKKAEPKNGRTTHLGEELGKDRYSDFPPGWGWNQALEFTNGNRNAAMLLVGLCAQEEQPEYNYTISGPVNVPMMYDDMREDEEWVKNLEAELSDSKTRSAVDREQLQKYLKQRQTHIQELKHRIEHPEEKQQRIFLCPSVANPFVAPKSLGETVDIPQELKNKIKTIQRPKGDPNQSLKAKYYHVTGSAFMGCQMAKCGLSAWAASQVEKIAGEEYRALRLCGKVRSNLQNVAALESQLKMKITDPGFLKTAKQYLQQEFNQMKTDREARKKEVAALIAQGFRGEEFAKRIKKHKCDSSSEEKTPLLFYLCGNSFFAPWDDTSSDDVGYLLREYDASLLYRKGFYGGATVAGIDIPCTSVKTNLFKNIQANAKDCGLGWPEDRCKSAMYKLSTWEVDYEWTKAQHEIGAKFGASQCIKQDPKEKPDKVFCDILEKSGRIPSSLNKKSKKK